MRQFFFIILVIFLGFCLGTLEYRAVDAFCLQYQAQSYPHVSGTVMSSKMTWWTGSKGRVYYRVSIRYSYSVDGADYTGWRYRYDGHPQDSASANAVVQAHPQGSAIDVYYNPQNPADAVLSVLVDNRDVGQLFMYTAMCLFMTWALSRAGDRYDWPWNRAAAGGVKVLSEGLITRVRLPVYPPLNVSLLALTGGCLAAGALMYFGFTTQPPLIVGGWLIMAVLLGTVGTYIWCLQRLQTGRCDLVIDEGARTVQFPLTFKRRQQSPVSWRQIQDVTVHKVRHRGSRGGIYYSYAVYVNLGGGVSEKLMDTSEGKANSLAQWLHEKFNLQGPLPAQENDEE